MADMINFPRQMLPYNKKGSKWAKQCVLWADSKTFFNYSLVRKSVIHKKINYDLLRGKLHMQDVQLILNPDNIQASFIPTYMQHYPIMNSKLEVLRGEELKRPFDYKVVVTNPNAITEIEEEKKNAVYESLKEWIMSTSKDEQEANARIQEIGDYFTYDWQSMRERRANELLNHYVSELHIPLMFNDGFRDAYTCGEEIYFNDIVGGEPYVEKVNPIKLRVFKSGYSNRIEDADVIIYEDYWSPGKIIDYFYDKLTAKDIEYLENLPDHVGQSAVDSMDNIDERYGFINQNMIGEEFTNGNDFFFDPSGLQGVTQSLLPYDLAGNVRVMRVFWKSKRKILKVKSYDPNTGEENYDFYPETYKVNESLGEEATELWINEAWEGTMIGGRNTFFDKNSDGIFVNMQPRPVQYNSLSNPSRCHLGFIGQIYNLNEGKPFSLVDMMKPYNYLYDAIHYRLNDAIASNWGDILEMDLANIPKGWDVNKWMYYAKINHIAVRDSFKEGTIGQSTGKLAGSMNNASKGIISSNTGNYIQQLINLLEYIKTEMGEIVGINKQREGQISNRETVGGVERATLQSSYITEWLFAIHDDVKKRELEALLETAKIALKGRKEKFQYIISGLSQKVATIDGDEFAECDYGLVVDNSSHIQDLGNKIDTLAQAALQNQAVDFSAIMKLWSTASYAEKMRIITRSEEQKQQQAQQMQEQQLQAQQQAAQMQLQMKQAEMEQNYKMNAEDNETKVLVAQIAANTSMNTTALKASTANAGKDIADVNGIKEREELKEKIRQFNLKLEHDNEKLALQKKKQAVDEDLKRRSLELQSKKLAK